MHIEETNTSLHLPEMPSLFTADANEANDSPSLEATESPSLEANESPLLEANESSSLDEFSSAASVSPSILALFFAAAAAVGSRASR